MMYRAKLIPEIYLRDVDQIRNNINESSHQLYLSFFSANHRDSEAALYQLLKSMIHLVWLESHKVYKSSARKEPIVYVA